MTPQEIRAAASQAAAMVVGPGGSAEEVMRIADVIGGYIARGTSLVPPDSPDPSARSTVETSAEG